MEPTKTNTARLPVVFLSNIFSLRSYPTFFKVLPQFQVLIAFLSALQIFNWIISFRVLPHIQFFLINLVQKWTKINHIKDNNNNNTNNNFIKYENGLNPLHKLLK